MMIRGHTYAPIALPPARRKAFVSGQFVFGMFYGIIWRANGIVSTFWNTYKGENLVSIDFPAFSFYLKRLKMTIQVDASEAIFEDLFQIWSNVGTDCIFYPFMEGRGKRSHAGKGWGMLELFARDFDSILLFFFIRFFVRISFCIWDDAHCS